MVALFTDGEGMVPYYRAMVVGLVSGIFLAEVRCFRLYCLMFSRTFVLFIKCEDLRQQFSGSVGSCMSWSGWCNSFCVILYAEHRIGCYVDDGVVLEE